MALARSVLVAAIAGGLRELLAEAELLPADTTGHLKEPIDQTFRALGVAEVGLAAATVADGSESAAIAIANYFTLARILNAVSTEISLSSVGSRAEFQQLYDHVKERLEAALVVAQGYGLVIAGAGSSGIVPIPYAGGIDAFDYAEIADDTSQVPKLFSLRDLGIRLGPPQPAQTE